MKNCSLYLTHRNRTENNESIRKRRRNADTKRKCDSGL